MNVRQIIREAITDLVTIDRQQIEDAVMNLDLSDMIAEAIADKLPDAIEEIVKEELDDVVSEVIDNALN